MRLGVALLLCCIGATSHAAELDQTAEFDIAPQRLASALLEFSTQGGVQILAADTTITTLQSSGVRGRFRLDAALRQLLRGMPIDYRAIGVDTVVLVAAVPQAPIATAPDPAPAERLPAFTAPTALEEIVITAQRRREFLQEAPLSVTVLHRPQLEQRGINGLTDLFSGAVPSLRIASFLGRTSLLTVSMRGIHSGEATQISRDAGVGIYLDGVYLGRSHGLAAELIDLDRMEILRGPQGTLFGRNAVGGAINIISRRPAGVFALEQHAGIDDRGGVNLATHLDLPRLGDFSFKLDASRDQSDGLVRNRYEPAWNFGQHRRHGARARVAWEPSERFAASYSFDRSEDRSAPYYLHLAELTSSRRLAPMFGVEPAPARETRTGVPLEPSVGQLGGHNLTLDWYGAAVTMRSITAYRTIDQTQFDNWAGGSESFRPERQFSRVSTAVMHQRQLSEELQLNASLPRLEIVAGAYYFAEAADDEAREFYSNRFNADGTGDEIILFDDNGVPLTRASHNYSRSRALFGQATWTPPRLDRRFAATAGLRLTEDDKHGHLTALNGDIAPPEYRYRFASSRVDPTAAIEFRPATDINLYLRWSTAYRAGGANSRSQTFRAFGPETIDSWELGVKSEWFDRRARFNLALYDMRYRHLQIGFLMPGNPVNTETVNTDRPARLRGVEIDFALLTPGDLYLGGSYTYSDARMPPQRNPFSGQEVQLAPILLPRHALTVEAEQVLRIGGRMRLALHADANFRSHQYTFDSDITPSQPALVVNARATLHDIALPRGSLSLSLWCRNLFAEVYEITGISGPMGPLAIYGDPRGFGIDAVYRFAGRTP